jgi:hypothetical protein
LFLLSLFVESFLWRFFEPAMAAATISNLAAVPTASLAYLKAARLESSPQSASSSLRVRSISSQSASSSSSSPRVRASRYNCFERILINSGCHHFSQDAILRAERAHHHRISASVNEVHVGNQASELVLINASVQQFLDTHAKFTSESYYYYSCYPPPPPPPPPD